MANQKTNPKLEQALTRGDLAIRQANSGRATAVLRALGKMIVEASATMRSKRSSSFTMATRSTIRPTASGRSSCSCRSTAPSRTPTRTNCAPSRCSPTRRPRCSAANGSAADGKIGRQEGRPLAMVAFITDVDIPWLDDED